MDATSGRSKPEEAASRRYKGRPASWNGAAVLVYRFTPGRMMVSQRRLRERAAVVG